MTEHTTPRAVADTCAAAPDAPPWQHAIADLGDVRLHYVEAGAGPLLILLHGFPEFWFAWRRQIPALAAAGFRVLAPDLRGYNLSDKPRGVPAYGIQRVVDDIRALIEHAGAARAIVVGHDWGAGVAWALAMRHPETVERLVILNGPHPLRMMQGLSHPSQLIKSWYIFLFQLPWLPERICQRKRYAILLDPLHRLRPPAPWAPEEYQAYRSALQQPGALPAMLNYYRAMLRHSAAVRLRRIEAPTLILWGDADPYLMPALAQPSPRWVPHARVEHLPNTGHFVQHEQPDLVNERIIAFARE